MQKQAPDGRKLLNQLEKTGRFVFHGSPRQLQKLEPQQQKNFDYERGRLLNDGKPAVCATQIAEVAIFRALVHQGWTSFGSRDGKIIFGASAIALRKAKTRHGYVHLLRKKSFRKHSPYELRSSRSVRPVRIITVSFKDLVSQERIQRKRKYLRSISGK